MLALVVGVTNLWWSILVLVWWLECLLIQLHPCFRKLATNFVKRDVEMLLASTSLLATFGFPTVSLDISVDQVNWVTSPQLWSYQRLHSTI